MLDVRPATASARPNQACLRYRGRYKARNALQWAPLSGTTPSQTYTRKAQVRIPEEACICCMRQSLQAETTTPHHAILTAGQDRSITELANEGFNRDASLVLDAIKGSTRM
jgi:hypothetical protein